SRIQDWVTGGKLESFLFLCCSLFAQGIELQGFVCDEVVQSGPQTVGLSPLLEEVIPRANRSGFEIGLSSQRLLKLAIDFGKQAREVPGGKVIARRRAGGGALHESPAVLLEVMPIPMRQEGIED